MEQQTRYSAAGPTDQSTTWSCIFETSWGFLMLVWVTPLEDVWASDTFFAGKKKGPSDTIWAHMAGLTYGQTFDRDCHPWMQARLSCMNHGWQWKLFEWLHTRKYYGRTKNRNPNVKSNIRRGIRAFDSKCHPWMQAQLHESWHAVTVKSLTANKILGRKSPRVLLVG